ncbi:MAG: acyl-CoA dehydrogenase family protein [Sulfobacillus thermotolerans]|nr:acyl-CoA dehydrogenase family protein [Sulfobacillus thermotolerans]
MSVVTLSDVSNQVPTREGINEYHANMPLVEGVQRFGAGWARDRLEAVGDLVGSPEFQHWAEEAERHPPELLTYDRIGRRVDEVYYHPAYHKVLSHAVNHGAHALAWREPRPGANVARAAIFMLFSQVEPGHGCPISMTHSAISVLRTTPSLAHEWEPRLTALAYDPELRPVSTKPGALCGMALTEKQGGSDLRTTMTVAHPVDRAGSGEPYWLTGDKWFCSAPMSDVFLTLARTPEGVSCFALPRIRPDGRRNSVQIQRLKDKLGNRSNASSEVTFQDAWAWMVGEPGRGVPLIMEMVTRDRLDCILGSTAGMRQGVAEAMWYAEHRLAFGRHLVDQSLMATVLADLCLESEAATASALRLARAYDDEADEQERLFRRVATPVLKYWVCKRGAHHAAEAMECLGGNGYIETFPLARRYREQPLLSIWEGSGNVVCLDVLRSLRVAGTLDAFLVELRAAAGTHRQYDTFVDDLAADLRRPEDQERRARQLTERMALALQGSLLLRFAPTPVAEAFCASRLVADAYFEYGTLPSSIDVTPIIERHRGHD